MCVQCVCSSLKGHSCELDFFFFFEWTNNTWARTDDCHVFPKMAVMRPHIKALIGPDVVSCLRGRKRLWWRYLFTGRDDYLTVSYISACVCVCVCVRSHFCLCIRWKPPISQAYQNGQSTSSWLRLWDWLLLPAWTAKHPKTDPGLACHSNRCGKISTYEPYTPLM